MVTVVEENVSLSSTSVKESTSTSYTVKESTLGGGFGWCNK
jgi:hypothetical protein